MSMKALGDEKLMLKAAFSSFPMMYFLNFLADIVGMTDVGKVPMLVLRLFGDVLRSG